MPGRTMNVTFKVQSHRNKNQFYEVTRLVQPETIEYDWCCSCPHYGYRTSRTTRRCKHIDQIIELIEGGMMPETIIQKENQ